MKNIKKIINFKNLFLIVLYAVIILLLFSLTPILLGCSYNDKVKTAELSSEDSTDNESASNSAPTTPENTDEQYPQVGETSSSEDTNSSETESAETTLPENPDIIEYKSSYLESEAGVIYMNINIKTGEVTGVTQLFMVEQGAAGFCEYQLNGSIKALMDLDTKKIDGLIEGQLDSKGDGCYEGDASFQINGILNQDLKIVSGVFASLQQGTTYKYFLKRVN